MRRDAHTSFCRLQILDVDFVGFFPDLDVSRGRLFLWTVSLNAGMLLFSRSATNVWCCALPVSFAVLTVCTTLSLPCFPDFRGKGGYTSLPPGGRPSSTVLYPGPPSSSPRPTTPPFSCLSRCNRAISYVVFLSFSFQSPGEHMPSLVVDPLSFVLHVLPTSSDSSPIFPSNNSVCQPPLSARPSSSVHSLHSSNPPHPVVFTHLQSMLVFLGHR